MKDVLNTWREIRPTTKEEWKAFLKTAAYAVGVFVVGLGGIYLGCLLG